MEHFTKYLKVCTQNTTLFSQIFAMTNFTLNVVIYFEYLLLIIIQQFDSTRHTVGYILYNYY